MTIPAGFTADEWNDLTEEERNGLLDIDDPILPGDEAGGDDGNPADGDNDSGKIDAAAVQQPSAADTAVLDELKNQNALLMQQMQELQQKQEQTLQQNAADSSQQDSAGSVKEPAFDLKEAIRLQGAALIDGDSEEYERISLQLEAHRTQEALKQLRAEQDSRDEQDRLKAESVKIDAYVAEVVDKYPFLNHMDNTVKNAVAIDEVREIASALMATGKTRLDSLQRAVALIAPKYATASSAGNNQGQEDPKPDARIPDLKTLAGLPQADSESVSGDPFAKLDSLQGEEYEAALERLTPAQRDAYLTAR